MMKWSLRLLPFFIFLVLALVLFFQLGKDPQYMPSALVGQSVPDFRLVTLEGNDLVTSSHMPKQPYLINFWGTWCPACHVEHPFLVELAQQGVIIIGIDYKDEASAAKQWLAQKGNPYQLVLQDELGQFGLDMGVTGAPETFVVNGQGMITFRLQGVLNEQSWQEVQRHLQ
ncbi:DsbE family thiol:disulfide interchange protein [Marinomonas sp. THO17]|uniref:DsbE family thiol:disulfide interchange protein n=1 Tax=Marinomonas sp. THO17 TaxID=3149048 RepID=UPI00336C1D9B